MKRIVFFGTPPFAAEIFRYLHANQVPIVGVVTQPDRPRGRSRQIGFSAVKETVLELSANTPLLQPNKASEESTLEQLRACHADLFVVVAYGQILSQKLLSIPPLGCINVHASLLPKYRGAAPIQRCLMAGDQETGVAIQKMVKELDAGDVIASQKIPISEEITAGELQEKLCELAKPLLLEVIQKFDAGIPTATPQDPTLVTYASKITLEEGKIHWDQPAKTIHNLIRAFSPRPGAWCWVAVGSEKKRLKILRSRIEVEKGVPGTLLSQKGVIACADGAIELLQVQIEGKKAMPAKEWLRGVSQSINFCLSI